MTETSKTPGPGSDSRPGPDTDLDFDFDLEALAGEVPGAPPVAPPTLADPEPEVVLFSKGSVVATTPAGVAPPPPVAGAPAPVPDFAPAPDLDDIGSDLDLLWEAEPPRSPGNALPPRRTPSEEAPAGVPARRPSTPMGNAPPGPPASDADADGWVVRKLSRAGTDKSQESKLPPRRGEETPRPSAAVPAWEVPPPAERREAPAAPHAPPGDNAPSPPGRAAEESRIIGPLPTPAGSNPEEASKALWGGRTPAEGAPTANRRVARGLQGWVERLMAVPRVWLYGAGAGCAVAVIVLIALSGGDGGKAGDGGDAVAPVSGINPKKGTDPLPEPVKLPPQPLDQTAALESIVASTPEARILAQYSELASETARRFFAATTVEEMLAVVRDPERVEPLMREFYSTNPLRPTECLGVHLVEGHDAMVGAKVFWLAKVDLKEAGREELLFEQAQSSSRKAFLLDWETTVNYNPMRWDAFAAEHPAEPLDMRVFCTVSTEYRPPFADETRFAAFLLTHPDGGSEVHAYVERESDTGQRLLALAEDDFEVRAYLKLRFPPGSTDCVEILGLVDAVDWLVVK